MNRMEPSVKDAPNHYVTEHFMYSDFICPCCDTLKIVPAFHKHAALLERMRRELGFDIVVTSGYRCAAHNKEVGGSPRSWHLLFATDVRPEDNAPFKLTALYKMALYLEFGGIGLYEAHVHLDLRPDTVRWRG